MKNTLFVVALLCLLMDSQLLQAKGIMQDLSNQEINVAELREDVLSEGAIKTYHLRVEGGQFVSGRVQQKSVDVVVRILDPENELVGSFDESFRGPEIFHITSEIAGLFRIELQAAGEEAGDYTLRIDLVEPTATTPEGKVDQLMAGYSHHDMPGGVVGVMEQGELIFSKAYGMADLAHAIPFTTETRTNIGSTSKQFTAFAIALLADRDALSLEDDVRMYLPELPDFGKKVTLRHLITHTSGYREFYNTVLLTGRTLQDHVDPTELVRVIQRQPALQNDPGDEWNYNNSGYGLLTMVVERVTGKAFPDWMYEEVFAPLGMYDTQFRRNQGAVIQNRSMGYLPGAGGAFEEARDLGGVVGAGGIYTTVGDMAKWMHNFSNPKVGNAGIMTDMMTPYLLKNGNVTDYGFGLVIQETGGLKMVQHGGSDNAHRAVMMYYPRINSGVVVFSNYGPFANPANQVAEAFLGRYFSPEPSETDEDHRNVEDKSFDASIYDPASFDEFVGTYALAAGFETTFSRTDSSYFVQATGQPPFPIFPTSDTTFTLKVAEASITFHRDPDGRVHRMTLHQNGEQIPGSRVTVVWEPTPEELAAFSGRYFSEELEAFYTLALQGGKLNLSHRRINEIALSPSNQDVFSGSFPVGEIAFQRSEAGQITGFTVSNGRARGILFYRVER